MKGARITHYILPGLALMALSACDSAPTDAVVRLKQQYASRPSVPEADNAFLDAFGFLGPEGGNAHELGARRVAWIEKLRADPKSAGPDPVAPSLVIRAQRSQALEQIVSACRAAIARACGSALERVDETPLSAYETLLLERYDGMLGRAGWFEIGTTDAENPVPSFEGPIEAQRLLLIRLRRAAADGEVAEVRAILTRDLAFWRRVLVSSDVLISKMIAIAAIRQHFTLGSYVLRALPANRIPESIPASWTEEFGDAERSMMRVMAGELMFAESMLASEANTQVVTADDEEEALQDPLEQLIDKVSRRAPRQPTLAEVADSYLATAKGFEVPLSQYETVSSTLRNRYGRINAGWDVWEYALRIGSAEGMRRAALLTLQLRSQSVPVAELPRHLKEASLRNPYNGQPFEWDAADQAVVFIGPEKNKWRRQAYPY